MDICRQKDHKPWSRPSFCGRSGVTPALQKKNRRVPYAPPGKFQLSRTCPPMPLRWLRRLRGGGKALAPLRTHHTEEWPQPVVEGKCDPRKPLSQGRGTPTCPQGASRGASAVPANHCNTPRLLDREPPARCPCPTPPAALPPFRTSGQQQLVISIRKGKSTAEGVAVPAGSKPEVRVSRVV